MVIPPMLPEEWDWVSPRTYTALYERFCYGGMRTSPAAEPQSAADVLVISGRVSLDTNQSGQLEPVYRTTGTERIPPAGSSYFVVLKSGIRRAAYGSYTVTAKGYHAPNVVRGRICRLAARFEMGAFEMSRRPLE